MSKWKKWIIGEMNWMRIPKSLALIYCILAVLAFAFSDHLIFQPPKPGYQISDLGMLQIARPQGEKVSVFHLKAEPDMPTILWSHGNAEDIGYLRERFLDFHARGYGVLAYDYPGYGHSDGKPNEQGCYEAVTAAYTHLTKTLQIPNEQIIIYGQSVGSGPAVWIASQKPCAGLILVSPFVSVFRAATKFPIFFGDKFKNINLIGDIGMPLLIVHGEQDQVISQWHGRKLHELHSGPKTFVGISDAGHNDLYSVASDDIFAAVDTFHSNIKQ